MLVKAELVGTAKVLATTNAMDIKHRIFNLWTKLLCRAKWLLRRNALGIVDKNRKSHNFSLYHTTLGQASFDERGPNTVNR